MLGPLPHPPKINIKMPALFKGKVPVVGGHVGLFANVQLLLVDRYSMLYFSSG